jgi:hypothetical protein
MVLRNAESPQSLLAHCDHISAGLWVGAERVKDCASTRLETVLGVAWRPVKGRLAAGSRAWCTTEVAARGVSSTRRRDAAY